MAWGEIARNQFTLFIQAAVSRLPCSEVFEFCFGVLEQKMHFKLLSELDSRELRTVFRRVGKRGEFCESQAIVQLTIFLVKIGQDPFLYRFPISESIDKAEASGVKEIQAAKDATEPKNATGVYASGVAKSDIASEVKEVHDAKDATEPKNATGGYASGVAECVLVKHVSKSRHKMDNIKAVVDESEKGPDLGIEDSVINVSESGYIENMKAVDNESKEKLDLGSKVVMEFSYSELADGGSAISETSPASEFSVCRTKSASFVFLGSFTASSSEFLGRSDLSAHTSCCLKKFSGNTSYEESLSMKKAKVLLMNPHRANWPPDSL